MNEVEADQVKVLKKIKTNVTIKKEVEEKKELFDRGFTPNPKHYFYNPDLFAVSSQSVMQKENDLKNGFKGHPQYSFSDNKVAKLNKKTHLHHLKHNVQSYKNEGKFIKILNFLEFIVQDPFLATETPVTKKKKSKKVKKNLTEAKASHEPKQDNGEHHLSTFEMNWDD